MISFLQASTTVSSSSAMLEQARRSTHVKSRHDSHETSCLSCREWRNATSRIWAYLGACPDSACSGPGWRPWTGHPAELAARAAVGELARWGRIAKCASPTEQQHPYWLETAQRRNRLLLTTQTDSQQHYRPIRVVIPPRPADPETWLLRSMSYLYLGGSANSQARKPEEKK